MGVEAVVKSVTEDIFPSTTRLESESGEARHALTTTLENQSKQVEAGRQVLLESLAGIRSGTVHLQRSTVDLHDALLQVRQAAELSTSATWTRLDALAARLERVTWLIIVVVVTGAVALLFSFTR